MEGKLSHLSVVRALGYLTACWIIYRVMIAIYNITYHPLAAVPGPKLAGITKLYQTFYCYHQGRSLFYRKVKDMHDMYGPIVRISPNEVSLSDSADFERVYNVRTKYYKDLGFYNVMGRHHGMFGTEDNSKHRKLRSPWERHFTRSIVASPRVNDLIKCKVDVLCAKARFELQDTGLIPIQGLAHALVMEVSSSYMLPEPMEMLHKRPYALHFAANVSSFASSIWIMMLHPIIHQTALDVDALMTSLGLVHNDFTDLSQHATKQVRDIFHRVKCKPEHEEKKDKSLLETMTCNTSAADSTLFTPRVLVDEAFSSLIAAAFNTGFSTSMILYRVISDGVIYTRLRTELLDNFPDESCMTYAALDRLPYMSACIKEGLRFAYSIIGRMPRVVPESGDVFQGHRLPPGTVVGTWAYVLHNDPRIWGSDVKSFNPERWLDPSASKYLGRFLMSFGKDNRACIARELALAMVYTTVGRLIREYDDLEVYGDFTADDLDDHYAAVLPPDAARLTLRRKSVTPDFEKAKLLWGAC